LDLDRNLAAAHAQIGDGKVLLGQPEETEAHIQEALRLSPRDRDVYLWCHFAALAKFQLGREEEAVVWLRRSIEADRNKPWRRGQFSVEINSPRGPGLAPGPRNPATSLGLADSIRNDSQQSNGWSGRHDVSHRVAG
jgi:tetratricopeptide (TPR) repeat protein